MKTSFILYFINLFYLIIPFIKAKNQTLQREINDWNIFKANLSNWKIDVTLEQNVNLIVFLTIFAVATTLLTFGLIKQQKTKK